MALQSDKEWRLGGVDVCVGVSSIAHDSFFSIYLMQ